ncbi:MAG: hypothetical protein DI534_07995 [Leifsonia xyli]|nr:MAG: hypothetical protein DI534_07995 [Leifsonia xyli]
MKVRELIAGSVFVEGRARADGANPLVTVILPTFRRGDSGMLKRSLDSLTAQTVDDLEIIVVDDASIDSTADVIREAMAGDPRISLIRHVQNIGLPAVSEYEAYRRARGELISFAFDDTVFAPDALEQLIEASRRSPSAMIAGHVRYFSRDPGTGELTEGTLGQGASEADLLAGYAIPNSGVLIPRFILEDVGLYDPHISVARVCDYDLWLRVRRRHPIEFVDVCVGEEHGPATLDSLGATYSLDHWVADDRIRTRRNELLRPDAFAEVEVFESGSFASNVSRRVVERFADAHLATRDWMRGTRASPSGAAPAIRVPRVLVLGHPLNASVLLVFEAMRDADSIHVRYLDRTSWQITELAGCDVLVVARDFASSADWSAAAIALGIPVFYYLDDDLPRMFTSGELDERWAHFAPVEVSRALTGFAGVITSTEGLAASFREQGIHDRVETLDIALPTAIAHDRPAVPEPAGSAGIALFTGDHRVSGFLAVVVPALVAVVERTGRDVRLIVPEPVVDVLPSLPTSIRVQGFPMSADYFTALGALRRAGADTLVVPSSMTGNQRFKTVHPLLTAAALGARLIAPDHPPYSSLADLTGVLLLDDAGHRQAWEGAFARILALDAEARVPAVSAELLTSRFDGAKNVRLLHDIITPRLGPQTEAEARLTRLSGWYAQQLAHSRRVAIESAAVPDVGSLPRDELLAFYDVLKTSRRLHVGTAGRGLLSVPSAGGDVERSVPLSLVPYLEYRVSISAGEYSALRLPVVGQAAPGDIIGIEIVDPLGRIELHRATALGSEPELREVLFALDPFVVVDEGVRLLRVFATTRRPLSVLEKTARGPWRARRPRVRLVFSLDTVDQT